MANWERAPEWRLDVPRGPVPHGPTRVWYGVPGHGGMRRPNRGVWGDEAVGPTRAPRGAAVPANDPGTVQ